MDVYIQDLVLYGEQKKKIDKVQERITNGGGSVTS